MLSPHIAIAVHAVSMPMRRAMAHTPLIFFFF